MKPDNHNTLINPRGRTHHIITEVLNTYYTYRHTAHQFAQQFARATEELTARAIFDYIITHIRYQEDPDGVQWIKTPARLLSDASGDCKSMAIFTATMLYNLHHPFTIRFVSFTQNPAPTHVYIVTRTGIIIDPVERINNQPIFNYATPYTHKIDYPMETTRISRLSGIGAEPDTTTQPLFITQTIAANYLQSELELATEILAVNPADTQARTIANTITIATNLYTNATGNPDAMQRAAHLLQHTTEQPDITTTDLTILETLLDQTITQLYTTTPITTTHHQWIDWWNENIIANNYNDFDTNRQDRLLQNIAAANRIGARKPTNAEINNLLEDIRRSSPYYMYALCPETYIKQLRYKYPNIYPKYLIERKLYINWVASLDGCINEHTIYNKLQSGFIARTGKTPQQFVEAIEAGTQKVSGIGLAPVVIAAIISGVVALLGSIINACAGIAQKKIESVDNYPDGTPSDYDFTYEDATTTPTTTASPTRLLTLGAIGLLIYKLTKK